MNLAYERTGSPEVTVILAQGSLATSARISAALVRTARSGRGDERGLELLDADLAGPVIVLSAPQEQVERVTLKLVRDHVLRAMDAWHLATTAIAVPPLTVPDEPRAFASRDQASAPSLSNSASL
ncbi:MAG: PIN domain-containing protein [Solirubrobacteraceae bacterium]